MVDGEIRLAFCTFFRGAWLAKLASRWRLIRLFFSSAAGRVGKTRRKQV